MIDLDNMIEETTEILPQKLIASAASTVELYLKKECSACKKAKAYLDRRRIKYRAIDIIENPPPRSFLEKWVSAKEIKKYLNPRADIYKVKNLNARIPTKTEAIRLMVKDPNLIKRPLIKYGNRVSFGFDERKIDGILTKS